MAVSCEFYEMVAGLNCAPAIHTHSMPAAASGLILCLSCAKSSRQRVASANKSHPTCTATNAGLHTNPSARTTDGVGPHGLQDN